MYRQLRSADWSIGKCSWVGKASQSKVNWTIEMETSFALAKKSLDGVKDFLCSHSSVSDPLIHVPHY